MKQPMLVLKKSFPMNSIDFETLVIITAYVAYLIVGVEKNSFEKIKNHASNRKIFSIGLTQIHSGETTNRCLKLMNY